MTMNWDAMRVFLAVARDCSLSAAARHLKVTQPTVGRRLGQLESDLGTRLFDRLPEGFVPTQAGEELLPIAEDMEKAAHALQRRRATLADTVSGTVRLSVFEVPAQFVTMHLPAIRANLPEIEIELSVNRMNANLSRREADLVLQVCLPDTPGLIARKLGELSYSVYGSQAYVAATPAARGNKRYQDCEWVAFDDDHVYFDGQTWLREKLAGRAPAIRMNNGHAIHDAVRNGAGLGVLPCFAGDSDPDLGRLTAPIQGVESDLNLVVHRDLKKVPSVRAAMDELIRLFKQEAPRLAGRSKLEAA